MGGPIAFVGDAITASGYRLAGVTVHVADEGGALAAFERALCQAQVVLVSATAARELPLARLAAAIAALAPLVMIVPEPDGGPPPVDPVARVRRQLGLEA